MPGLSILKRMGICHQLRKDLHRFKLSWCWLTTWFCWRHAGVVLMSKYWNLCKCCCQASEVCGQRQLVMHAPQGICESVRTAGSFQGIDGHGGGKLENQAYGDIWDVAVSSLEQLCHAISQVSCVHIIQPPSLPP